MDVKNFENNRWGSFNQPTVFRHKIALEFIKRGKVLDLGCGDGHLLQFLKDKKIEAVGLDISEVAVEKGKAKNLDVQCLNLNNTKLPFANDEFEYAVMLDILEHVFSPENLLAEAARVAKNVILSVPNFSSLPARLQVLTGRVPENNTPKKGHVYWFNRKVLFDLLAKNNLIVTDLKINTIWEDKIIFKNMIKALSKLFPIFLPCLLLLLCEKIINL